MKKFKLFSLFVTTFYIGLFVGCKQDDQVPAGIVKVTFTHTIDGQELVLGDKEFINTAGNRFLVEKLKYYISNVKLIREDGSFFSLPDGYFLIEESNISRRREIELAGIPAGSYTALTFAIGVDSVRNFSTQMVGDLNPNNDMAWNWVSGYKFFLLEGKYTTDTQLTDAIVYHIGGNTSYRTISLNTQSGDIPVSGSKITEISIQANVNKVFDAASLIDLNEIHNVMEPGEQADKIADNYTAGMFVIQQVVAK